MFFYFLKYFLQISFFLSKHRFIAIIMIDSKYFFLKKLKINNHKGDFHNYIKKHKIRLKLNKSIRTNKILSGVNNIIKRY
jgi:hypothetical protein